MQQVVSKTDVAKIMICWGLFKQVFASNAIGQNKYIHAVIQELIVFLEKKNYFKNIKYILYNPVQTYALEHTKHFVVVFFKCVYSEKPCRV